MDWVGLGHRVDGLDWIGFGKLDPRPTLVALTRRKACGSRQPRRSGRKQKIGLRLLNFNRDAV